MARFDAQVATIVANFQVMNEKMDFVTNDITRLHARIAELAGQEEAITQEQIDSVLALSSQAKDRLTDMDAATPEV